jgi:hypothetical protein
MAYIDTIVGVKTGKKNQVKILNIHDFETLPG